MNQEKIGKFICKIRKEKNMTQQELADKIGVTDRAISKWENGRGMPDLSLISRLCEELNITVNELLSGERLNNQEYQEKFEENIINTLYYSNKKVKSIKLTFIVCITIVVLTLMTLLVLFGIDINRMRNNEPVFFSTWGFKYAPPVNLDNVNIETTIKQYLIENDEKHHQNEKSFVAMKTYLITEDSKDKYFVYAWVLQENYYEENGEIINDTGSSIPYKFELVKIDDEFIVENYDIPRDGTDYAKDMKRIFPNRVLNDMDNVHIDGTIERLMLDIEQQVKLYFHK